VAPGQRWVTGIVALGSVIAHTAVLLVFQLGQPRIFFSMARDGLLPQSFAKVHPRFRTPHVTTILTGVLVGGFAGVASIDEMVDLTNIGTLFAFVLVCIGIPILRYTDPARPRPFRVPFGPWLLPMLGVVSCLFLMFYLPPASWWRFIGWLLLGMSIYISYGYNNSTVGKEVGRPSRAAWPQKLSAFGFFLAAIGLFIIPHNAGPGHLLEEASSALNPDHGRALWGLVLIVAGILAGLAGLMMGRQEPESEA
jgi:APA family basic amino acid/polyamine antiporter